MLKQKNLIWFLLMLAKKVMKNIITLIKIVNKITGFEINFIKVTDYNAAVEAMRADRAHILLVWWKNLYKSSSPLLMQKRLLLELDLIKDAGYYTYFVVKKDSKIKKFSDIKGKVLSLNSIGSTSGDLIPQVEIAKINLSIKNKKDFKNVFYAGSHDACLISCIK